MAGFERVADIDELPDCGRKEIVVDDLPALLLRSGNNYYAIEDICTHDEQPLTDGDFNGIAITCPRHGARFDVVTGDPLCMPATEPLRTFSVEVRDNAVYVSTDPATKKTANQSDAGPSAKNTVPAQAETTTSSTDDAEVDISELSGEAKLIEALKQVIDPELMINIIDLGLVYEIEQNGGKVDVNMTLTSPACPVGPQIMQQSKMALERLREVDLAEIRLVMTPPWTPERMTDAARDHLGIF